MSEEMKKYEITVNDEAYSVIKHISEEYNITEHEIVDYIMRGALEEYVRGYEAMKNGYKEMGKLNLEISNAFAVSEHEALHYID